MVFSPPEFATSLFRISSLFQVGPSFYSTYLSLGCDLKLNCSHFKFSKHQKKPQIISSDFLPQKYPQALLLHFTITLTLRFISPPLHSHLHHPHPHPRPLLLLIPTPILLPPTIPILIPLTILTPILILILIPILTLTLLLPLIDLVLLIFIISYLFRYEYSGSLFIGSDCLSVFFCPISLQELRLFGVSISILVNW